MTAPELVRLMVGRELAAVYPKREVPLGDAALALHGLTNVSRGIRDVSFAVRRERFSASPASWAPGEPSWRRRSSA